MTTTEAAELLGIDPGTVGVQIRKGKILAEKRGRDYDIPPSEVERYRREHLGRHQGPRVAP